MFAAIASASLMAWAGEAIAHLLPEPAQGMLVAIALLLAAAELAWPNRERLPQEPTRSFFAIFVVLLARQLGDGARFLLFALSAATVSPLLVAAGGSLGGMAAVGIGWGAGESIEKYLPLRVIRLVLAAVLLAVAAVLALNARGIVG
jgi:putative Ca2+/H+ antiporter (TMEM165/GDT1 family)